MTERKRVECRSCGAAIEWAVSEKTGKLMPLDFDVLERGAGNVTVVGELANGTPIARYVAKSSPQIGDRVSHFATCPNAAKHRVK